MYSVENSTLTAMMETSPVTGVRLEKEYSVGAPSSRKASNQPFIYVASSCELSESKRVVKSLTLGFGFKSG